MNKTTHRIFIIMLMLIVITSFVVLALQGFGYYRTGMEDRFFHPKNDLLKPSGFTGHGLGIAGSAMIIFGVFSYMARKRFRRLSRLGYLKHWLEFHIFLCVLGPVLILFHTSFKFGGIVAISFWSMVAVVLSGVIGRFIYIQIPRSMGGRALSLNEIRHLKNEEAITRFLPDAFKDRPDFSGRNGFAGLVAGYRYDRSAYKLLRSDLKKQNLSGAVFRQACKLLRNEITLNRKIEMLVSMQKLLGYWHVAHLPFALAMLIVMLIHVAVVIAFGYKWIF
jgi:hypothetical protein